MVHICAHIGSTKAFEIREHFVHAFITNIVVHRVSFHESQCICGLLLNGVWEDNRGATVTVFLYKKVEWFNNSVRMIEHRKHRKLTHFSWFPSRNNSCYIFFHDCVPGRQGDWLNSIREFDRLSRTNQSEVKVVCILTELLLPLTVKNNLDNCNAKSTDRVYWTQ